MPLQLVPPGQPDSVETLRQRIKKMPNPDGMLQCNRCGSRTVLNTENGVAIKNGKRQRGTKIETDICADCWKRGIVVPMVTELRPVF